MRDLQESPAFQDSPAIEYSIAEKFIEVFVVARPLCLVEGRVIEAFLLTTDNGGRHIPAEEHCMYMETADPSVAIGERMNLLEATVDPRSGIRQTLFIFGIDNPTLPAKVH